MNGFATDENFEMKVQGMKVSDGSRIIRLRITSGELKLKQIEKGIADFCEKTSEMYKEKFEMMYF